MPMPQRGSIEVGSQHQDFFKVVIEERKRLSSRFDPSAIEKEQLDKALKVLANAASYGIHAEIVDSLLVFQVRKYHRSRRQP